MPSSCLANQISVYSSVTNIQLCHHHPLYRKPQPQRCLQSFVARRLIQDNSSILSPEWDFTILCSPYRHLCQKTEVLRPRQNDLPGITMLLQRGTRIVVHFVWVISPKTLPSKSVPWWLWDPDSSRSVRVVSDDDFQQESLITPIEFGNHALDCPHHVLSSFKGVLVHREERCIFAWCSVSSDRKDGLHWSAIWFCRCKSIQRLISDIWVQFRGGKVLQKLLRKERKIQFLSVWAQ